MTLSKIASIIIMIFFVIMYFFIIPIQIQEPMFAGYVSTDTFPKITILGILIFSVVQLFEKKQQDEMDKSILLKTLFMVVIGLLSAYLMTVFGFLIVAPLLSVAIMLFAGERRLPLLLFGLIIPIIIWYCSEVLLDRPLP